MRTMCQSARLAHVGWPRGVMAGAVRCWEPRACASCEPHNDFVFLLTVLLAPFEIERPRVEPGPPMGSEVSSSVAVPTDGLGSTQMFSAPICWEARCASGRWRKGYRNLSGMSRAVLAARGPRRREQRRQEQRHRRLADGARAGGGPAHEVLAARPRTSPTTGGGRPITDELELDGRAGGPDASREGPDGHLLVARRRGCGDAQAQGAPRRRRAGADPVVRRRLSARRRRAARSVGGAFIYLHPLRDAAARPQARARQQAGRTDQRARPRGSPRSGRDRRGGARPPTTALDSIAAIVKARRRDRAALDAMTGGGRLRPAERPRVRAIPRFERVVGALRAKIGELAALEMAENGLGYNNLLYMAVLLAAIAEPDARRSRRCGCCSSRSPRRTCTPSCRSC